MALVVRPELLRQSSAGPLRWTPFPLIAHPAFRSAPEQQGFSNINRRAVAMQSIRAVIVVPPQPPWARVLRDPPPPTLSLTHTHSHARTRTLSQLQIHYPSTQGAVRTNTTANKFTRELHCFTSHCFTVNSSGQSVLMHVHTVSSRED